MNKVKCPHCGEMVEIHYCVSICCGELIFAASCPKCKAKTRTYELEHDAEKAFKKGDFVNAPKAKEKDQQPEEEKGNSMDKIKCPHCGEMVEPDVKTFWGVFVGEDDEFMCICPECGAKTYRYYCEKEAVDKFKDGKFSNAPKVEKKDQLQSEEETGNNMEKVECPNCGELVEPMGLPDDYGIIQCICPKCHAIAVGYADKEMALDSFKKGDFINKLNHVEPTKDQKNDMVNHPNHYCKAGKMECRKLIELVVETLELGFAASYYLGCMIKYLYRYKNKQNPKQDLEKALKYAEFMVERLEQQLVDMDEK